MASADDTARTVAARSGRQVGRRAWFLRRRSWLCRLFAVSFVVACAGAAFLVVISHWSTSNALVCFFTVCPSFACFGALLPFVLAGLWAVRLRWFLLGCALWAGGFAATDDVAQWLKPWPSRHRAAFESAHAAFLRDPLQGAAREDSLAVPLRIVTWNLASRPAQLGDALNALAALQPDIVFLQEANATALADALKGCEGFAGYRSAASQGRALLSRFPLASEAADSLPSWRGDARRVELAPGFEIVCINVHLGRRILVPRLVRTWRPSAFDDAIARTGQRLEELRETIARHAGQGRAVIVAGDFNLPPRYPDVRAATAALQDCFGAGGSGWGKTVRASTPVFRIDMIYVPKDAAVRYARAVPTALSDHRMTLAEVVVPVSRREGAEGP